MGLFSLENGLYLTQREENPLLSFNMMVLLDLLIHYLKFSLLISQLEDLELISSSPFLLILTLSTSSIFMMIPAFVLCLYLLPVLKVLVVNTIILKLSSSLMFLISPVLDVIPLISALLNLNFHLLMLSMLLLEEFPSTHHQIQLQLQPQLHPKPELQLPPEHQLHPELEPQPHPELHLHLDHVSHSVLAQVSLAKLHTMLMMTQVPAMMKLFTL